MFNEISLIDAKLIEEAQKHISHKRKTSLIAIAAAIFVVMFSVTLVIFRPDKDVKDGSSQKIYKVIINKTDNKKIEYKDINELEEQSYVIVKFIVSTSSVDVPKSNVVTDIIIKDIYEKDNTDLKVKQKIKIKEPYYYEATYGGLDGGYSSNKIISEDYFPLEKGKTYILFLKSYDTDDIPLLSAENVYCISDNNVEYMKEISDFEKYKELWLEVKDKYK